MTPRHLAERMTIARSPRKMMLRAALWTAVAVAAGIATAITLSDGLALVDWIKRLLALVLGAIVLVNVAVVIGLVVGVLSESGDIELTAAGFRFMPKGIGDHAWLNCGQFESGSGVFVAVRFRVFATKQTDDDGQPVLNRTIADHYNLGPAELAATLNAFRDRALGRAV